MFICLPKSSIFTASAYWGFPGRHTLLKILLSAMAGVGVISSVAVFLFLLLASFSAARQERSPRAWAAVTDQSTFNYLALLTFSGNPACSGSIPSQWTVLTFCTAVTAASNTKAYAGVLKITELTNPDVQERNVKKIADSNDLSGLKICILEKIWNLNAKVGSITVSASKETSCTVLGFGTVTARGGDAQIARKQSVALATDNCEGIGADVIGSSVTAAGETTEKLEKLDLGGPLVCGDVQHGISKEYNPATAADKKCNLYIAIADHSDWINTTITAAETADGAGGAGGAGGTGGAGGNGTASSGYSIHSHLNKYSNWKVLWFLVPPIVAFLQY